MMGQAWLVIMTAPLQLKKRRKKMDLRLLKWLNVSVSQYEMYVLQSAIKSLFPKLEV